MFEKITLLFFCIFTITDEFVKIQKNNNVIFSNTTALYFHNLTDRVPNTISITVPQGYNVLHITKKFENSLCEKRNI